MSVLIVWAGATAGIMNAAGDKTTRAPSDLSAVRGRVIELTATSDGCRIIIDRGTHHGVARGMHGSLLSADGKPLPNGAFVIFAASERESKAKVRVATHEVSKARNVLIRVSPP